MYWQVFHQAGTWLCLLGGPYPYGWHLCSVERGQEGCESTGLWGSRWAVNQFYPLILYLAALKQRPRECNWLNTISGQFGFTARVVILYFYKYIFLLWNQKNHYGMSGIYCPCTVFTWMSDDCNIRWRCNKQVCWDINFMHIINTQSVPDSVYLSQVLSVSPAVLFVVSIFMISAFTFHTLITMFPRLIQLGIQLTIVILFSQWYAILPA